MESTSGAVSDEELLEQGLDRLRSLLSPAWEVEPLTTSPPETSDLPSALAGTAGPDRVYEVRSDTTSRHARLLVEAKQAVTPGRIDAEITPQMQLMRQLTGDAAVLVIAPWLSPRIRRHLEELQYGYLDITGNVFLRLPSLGIVIKTQGTAHGPQQPQRRPWRQRLRGDKAGSLVRVLIDVAPPHQASRLAAACGLSLPYVSRLLDAMEEQALVKRERRTIVEVDWAGLIRERSDSYQLLKAHPPTAATAVEGIEATLERLSTLPQGVRKGYAVTGHVAAAAVAPLAIGGQLMIHVSSLDDGSVRQHMKNLRLLPAKSKAGGEVLLLRTESPEVFENTRLVSGVAHVALGQLALDCLGGPGRMPAEGEAVLEEMARSESSWRLANLDNWGPLLR